MSNKLKIILLIVLVAVIAVFVVVNLKKGKGDEIEVSISKIERGDITRTISGSGMVQPEIEIDLSARISAEILKIHVEEGQAVSRGQLLVELDKDRYEAAVEQAESQKLSAQAELKKADADYSRVKDLFDKNLTSEADLDAAEALQMSAQSRVRQMRAFLKQALDDLVKTKLLAPINGVIVKIYKEEGEIAVGSQFQADPIVNVSDLSNMEVLSEIDENDVVFVKIDDKTNIEVDAIPDTILNGRVSEIAHMATTRGRGTQEQVTNFEVKIAITSNIEKLRPGMSATVDIESETHKDVLFVPIQCVTVRDAKADTTQKEEENEESKDEEPKGKKPAKKEEVVFVVNEGVVEQVAVVTGISDDTNVEIVSGVEEGQEVVSGSYKALSLQLKDGSSIKIKEDLTYRETSE